MVKSLSALFVHCEDDYSLFNEEKRSFEPGWNNLSAVVVSNASIDRAFQYRSPEQLDTQPVMGNHGTYGSGGYVYEFRGRLIDLKNNLSQLHATNWIDGQTRAVIVQFTLYNPNVQLFTSVSLLAEFLPTGGVETQSKFQPISFVTFKSITHLIASILYLLVIVHMMIVEVQSLIKLKRDYFRQFWSYIDVGIIVCSWTNVGIYVWRYGESNRIGDAFARSHGYASVNLQVAAYVDDLFTCLLAFACFFATIKFIRLGRFNRRLMFFVHTLQHAASDLLSFVSMFSVVFWAFITLFYLLFVGQLLTCSTLLHTAKMLFEMTLMKFDAQELSSAAPLLGPLVFSLFIFVVVFVCMSMFLTIINESFGAVRQEAALHVEQEQHIFSFMVDRFQRAIGMFTLSLVVGERMSVAMSLGLLGLGRSTDLCRQEDYDEEMRSKYVDPVENFPNKMDQLLDALDRVSDSILVSLCRPEVCIRISTGVHGSARPSNWSKQCPSQRLKDSCFRCCACDLA